MSAFLAILRLTAAQGLRSPACWLAALVTAALLGLTAMFGFFTFTAEDRLRLVITAGVAAVALATLFSGVVTAAIAVHAETSERTALALFARPVRPIAFLAGKAGGAFLAAAIPGALLAGAHLGLVALIGEHGFWEIEIGGCGHAHHAEDPVSVVGLEQVAFGHVLALAQAGTMTCLTAVLAVRLPPAGAIPTAFAVFAGSHLLVAAGHAAPGLLPALGLCNPDEALQFSTSALGFADLGLGLLHLALYALASLLVGLAWFARREAA